MPGQIVAEIAQAIIQLFCYLTARLLLPVVTFGRVHVEPAPNQRRIVFRWHGVQRMANGSILLCADAGSLVGMVFWLIIIGLGILVYYFIL
jgi:hypothetical protein